MEGSDTLVAVFPEHAAAEAAVKKLTAAGFEMKNLSVVGKGLPHRRKGRRILQYRRPDQVLGHPWGVLGRLLGIIPWRLNL